MVKNRGPWWRIKRCDLGGSVVNYACCLAKKAGRDGFKPLVVSSIIYSNLNEHNQGLLNSITIDCKTYY